MECDSCGFTRETLTSLKQSPASRIDPCDFESIGFGLDLLMAANESSCVALGSVNGGLGLNTYDESMIHDS